MTDLLMLLAQATQPAQPNQPPPMGGWEIFLRQMFPIFLIIAVFWWWMSRLRKNSAIASRTCSIICNATTRCRPSAESWEPWWRRGNEVILKVDETSNVKMRFSRSAIKEVTRETQDSG